MPADDRVQPRHLAGEMLIAAVSDMGQRDDRVDALVGQILNIRLEAFHVILKDHARPRRGGFGGVHGQGRHDADPFAAQIQDRDIVHLAVQQIGPGQVEIARQDRKIRAVRQHGQPLGSVVEFVIADRHRVIADGRHELHDLLALVGGVEQRSLILVARVQHDHRLAPGLDPVAQLADLRGEARDAAKAFAGLAGLLLAGAVVFVDRLDPAVQVVRMQDVQHRLGLGRTREQRRGGQGGQKAKRHG